MTTDIRTTFNIAGYQEPKGSCTKRGSRDHILRDYASKSFVMRKNRAGM